MSRRANILVLLALMAGLAYGRFVLPWAVEPDPAASADEAHKEDVRPIPFAGVDRAKAALVFIQEARRRPGKDTDARPALGIIIDPRGVVVTNQCRIAGLQEIEVVLSDGRIRPAKAVLRYADLDLALIKITDAQPLPHVVVGDSDKAQMTDHVLVLNAPWARIGDEPSVTITAGLIGGIARRARAPKGESFFWVDTSIGPGCGPGPLINPAGEFIGLVVGGDLARRGANVAVPGNRVMACLAGDE
jgi:serine protease Do